MASTENVLAVLKSENEQLRNSLQELETKYSTLLKVHDDYELSQKRFRTIFEESHFGNKIIGEDLNIIKVNPALLRILGYSADELIGQKIIKFTHPDFIDEWEELRRQLWGKHSDLQSFSIDTCLIRKDQTTVWCHVTSIIFLDGSQRLGYTILEDISARKEADRLREELLARKHALELLEKDQQQQKELVKNTVKAQEDERQRISERLHNSLGQLLFGVRLHLEGVITNLEADDIGTSAKLNEVKDLLSAAMRECRELSHNLFPTILKDYGLKAAIAEICRSFSGDIKFDCSFEGRLEQLDKYHESIIYYIIQELTLNILKHSKATTASCSIRVSQSEVEIAAQDNGVGIATQAGSAGIGLKSIRHRVQSLNGNIELTTPGEGGSRVVIYLPLS